MRKVKAWRKGIISAALLLSLGATGLFARDKGSAAAIRQVSAQERTVTGCLRKGTEQSSFDLMADDGTVWILIGSTVTFGDHVGHKVRVSGDVNDEADAQEQRKGDSGKKETAGPQQTLHVRTLKVISNSCK